MNENERKRSLNGSNDDSRVYTLFIVLLQAQRAVLSNNQKECNYISIDHKSPIRAQTQTVCRPRQELQIVLSRIDWQRLVGSDDFVKTKS